jgi:hypothetical protein
VVVTVELQDTARDHVREGSAADGVPPALWLSIAIEAERCLGRAAAALSLRPEEVAAACDDASDTTLKPTGVNALDRLREYASALRRGEAEGAALVGSSVLLTPAMHVGAAWAAEACSAGIGLDRWVGAAASSLPPGRIAWEAASAAAAQSLAEWTLAQAARRRRAASTSAQATG